VIDQEFDHLLQQTSAVRIVQSWAGRFDDFVHQAVPTEQVHQVAHSVRHTRINGGPEDSDALVNPPEFHQPVGKRANGMPAMAPGDELSQFLKPIVPGHHRGESRPPASGKPAQAAWNQL
jgi:hypothetical protein